jgi:hypothetical protein
MADTKLQTHFHKEEIDSSKEKSEYDGRGTRRVVGNVQLLVDNETVLIPTPSPDPNGAYWQ